MVHRQQASAWRQWCGCVSYSILKQRAADHYRVGCDVMRALQCSACPACPLCIGFLVQQYTWPDAGFAGHSERGWQASTACTAPTSWSARRSRDWCTGSSAAPSLAGGRPGPPRPPLRSKLSACRPARWQGCSTRYRLKLKPSDHSPCHAKNQFLEALSSGVCRCPVQRLPVGGNRLSLWAGCEAWRSASCTGRSPWQ